MFKGEIVADLSWLNEALDHLESGVEERGLIYILLDALRNDLGCLFKFEIDWFLSDVPVVVKFDIVDVVPHFARQDKRVVFLLVGDSVQDVLFGVPIGVMSINVFRVSGVVEIGQVRAELPEVVGVLRVSFHYLCGSLVVSLGNGCSLLCFEFFNLLFDVVFLELEKMGKVKLCHDITSSEVNHVD